jgi:hypothetical protein
MTAWPRSTSCPQSSLPISPEAPVTRIRQRDPGTAVYNILGLSPLPKRTTAPSMKFRARLLSKNGARGAMSALGQKQTFAVHQLPMSALPPKADIRQRGRYVRFVPEADIGQAQLAGYSMTSSARASTDGGIVRPSAFAVLRLITSWSLVGACTGRSAGFSPLRMRST